MITEQQITDAAEDYTYAMEKRAFVDGAFWAKEQMQPEIDRIKKALQIIIVEMDRITVPAKNISELAKKALE